MKQYTQLFDYLNSFANLTEDYKRMLITNSTIKHIEKDAIYFDKKTYSNKLGFLFEGIMRIYDTDNGGNQWNKVFLSTPSFLLGNPNFEEKSAHFVETITPCEVIEFPISFIKENFDTYPQTREIQTKILYHLFEKKSKREYDFLTLNAKERYLKCQKEYEHIIDRIPQFHLASYLGITTTQLSRINVSLRNQQM